MTNEAQVVTNVVQHIHEIPNDANSGQTPPLSIKQVVPMWKTRVLVLLAVLAGVASFWYIEALFATVFFLACGLFMEAYKREQLLHDADVWKRASAKDRTAHMRAVSELGLLQLKVQGFTRDMDDWQRAHEASVQERRKALAGYVTSLERADASALEVIDTLLSPMKPETAVKRIAQWEANSGRYGPYVVAALQ